MEITAKWVPTNRPELVAQEIFAISEYLMDRGAPLSAAAEITNRAIKERFENQHGPNGEHWAEWADSYASEAEQTNAGILMREEKLYEAATSEHAFRITPDAVFYDTSGLPRYGMWMQFGTEDGRIPARPFLGSDEKSDAAILSVFYDWFDASLYAGVSTKAGFGVRYKGRGMGGRFA